MADKLRKLKDEASKLIATLEGPPKRLRKLDWWVRNYRPGRPAHKGQEDEDGEESEAIAALTPEQKKEVAEAKFLAGFNFPKKRVARDESVVQEEE